MSEAIFLWALIVVIKAVLIVWIFEVCEPLGWPMLVATCVLSSVPLVGSFYLFLAYRHVSKQLAEKYTLYDEYKNGSAYLESL